MLWRLVTMHHGAENSSQKEKSLHNPSDQLFGLNLWHFAREHNCYMSDLPFSPDINIQEPYMCQSL